MLTFSVRFWAAYSVGVEAVATPAGAAAWEIAGGNTI
jgi:hypothetical protein